MLLSLLLSTLVPIVTDMVKTAAPAVSRKMFGVSVDDQIKLETAQVERTKALAELDNPYGTPSQWVVDLRGSFRYVSAAILILTGVGLAAYGAVYNDLDSITTGIEVASAPFGFIFGERLMLTIRGGSR